MNLNSEDWCLHHSIALAFQHVTTGEIVAIYPHKGIYSCEWSKYTQEDLEYMDNFFRTNFLSVV